MINKILRRIKGKIEDKRENVYLKKFLGNNGFGIYNFTEDDLNLYMIEKRILMPHMNCSRFDDKLEFVAIANRGIYWPHNIDNRDLPWLYHEIFDKFSKNPSSYDHINMRIDEASWVVDAGCCEGYFSLFTFEKNKKAKVIAIEPIKEMEEVLFKTFESENISNRFFLEKKALGAKSNMIQFNFNPEHVCDSSIDNHAKDVKNSAAYDVEVVTLDLLSKTHNLFEDGFIKMDIEGSEMDALRGGQSL